MSVSQLHLMLRRHEGEQAHAYLCPAGYLTIGIGRNIDPDGGLGLSRDEIAMLLNNDLARCRTELQGSFDWFDALEPTRQDALLDLLFNLGLPRFQTFRKMIAALARQDYTTAAAELLNSKYARQVGDRAEELALMLRTGQYRP